MPGRGYGGPDLNLQTFGRGIKVVRGSDAKIGTGSLFVPARSTVVPKQIDPANPFQNSYLARDTKGTPIKGLPSGNEDYTIAAWYSVSASKPGRFGVVSFGKQENNQANLFKVTDGGQTLASNYGDQSLESKNKRDKHSGTWHHGVITYSKEKGLLSMYIDGNLSSTRNITETPPQVSKEGAFFLAMSANGPESEQFSGFLDDVAIFRVALNPAEIAEIKKGHFEPYLDLFALRGCKTRMGRRQHGAGFIRGAKDETISIDDGRFKYGFAAPNAFACSVKCAQTSNCRQGVFIADAPTAEDKKAPVPAVKDGKKVTKPASSRPGRCFLQAVAYSTYEEDASATSVTCGVPSDRLQKTSFLLKVSADFEKQTAARALRTGVKEAKKIVAKKADAKKSATSMPGKPAKPSAQAAAASMAAATKKVADKESVAKSSEAAKLAEKKSRALKDKLRKEQERLKAEKKKEAHERKTHQHELERLRRALKAKERALKERIDQATHRELAERRRSAAIIKKLNARLRKLEKQAVKKATALDSAKAAARIRAAADKKAADILIAAHKQAAKVREQTMRAHQRRLRARRAARRKAHAKAKNTHKKTRASARKANRKHKRKL